MIRDNCTYMYVPGLVMIKLCTNLKPIYFPNLCKKTRRSVRILILYQNRLMDESVLLFQGKKWSISLAVLRKLHILFGIHKYISTCMIIRENIHANEQSLFDKAYT